MTWTFFALSLARVFSAQFCKFWRRLLCLASVYSWKRDGNMFVTTVQLTLSQLGRLTSSSGNGEGSGGVQVMKPLARTRQRTPQST